MLYSAMSSGRPRTARNSLLFTFLAMACCSLTTALDTVRSSSRKVVSMPLIPHHVQKSRRLTDNNNSNSPFTKQQLEEIRSHCPRFQLMDLSSNHTRPEFRHLRATYNAQQVASLFQGYGTHYADLWCGTPPQRQTVIVDTGSGVTAFPCSECQDCGVPQYHIDALFDEQKSSSYRVLSCAECLRGHCDRSECKMGQSYQEGSSWTAREVEDLCYVGGLHGKAVEHDDHRPEDEDDSDIDPYHAPNFAFPLKFGCQTRITGLFKTQLADGIMGMDIANAAFWEQMYGAGKIDHKAFSMCFSRSPNASREGTGAGAMSMGGADERLHASEMVYSMTDDNAGFYVVHVRKAYLRPGGGGDSALSPNNAKVVPLDLSEDVLNKGRVIVDSGTTDTYFHRGIAKAFDQAFRAMSGKSMDHSGHKMTKEQVDALPTIMFQLNGDIETNKEIASRHNTPVPGLAGDLDPENPYDVILAIPPSHYMEYDADDGKFTSRFYTDESRGSVLGANAMMGHDVLFDMETGKIGWAESDCDYKKLVDDYYSGKLPIPTGSDSKREDKKVTPNDESRFKPEDKETENVINNAPNEFCTGLTCQVTLGMGLVGTIVLVGLRLARRSFSNTDIEYELSAAELEMQTPPSAYRDDDGNDESDEEGEFT